MRTIVSIVLILTVALLAAFVVGRSLVRQGYEQIEHQLMMRDLDRAEAAFANGVADVEEVASDYGAWDDTRQYLSDRDPGYLISNFPLRTFQDLEISTLIIADTNGEIAYSQAVNDARTSLQPVPDDLVPVLRAADLFAVREVDQARAGLLQTPTELLIVAAHPILGSNGERPAAGTLVVVRCLDAFELRRLSDLTQLNLSLAPDQAPASGVPLAPADFSAAFRLGPLEQPAVAGEGERRVVVISDHTVIGEARLIDINGTPVGWLRVTDTRVIYQQGQRMALAFVVTILVIGVLAALVGLQFMQHLTLSRVDALARDVAAIASSGDATRRVSVRGQDELSQVELGVNRMLEALERSQQAYTQARDEALEAGRLRTQLFANVSHDLRTPINAIVGFTEMIREGVYGAVSPEQFRVLTRIRENAQDLLLQVSDLLDASTLEVGHLPLRPTYFTAEELLAPVADAGEQLAHQKDLAFRVEVAPGVPARLWGDPERIRQALLNLIHNAVKYTERGGVMVRVGCDGPAQWRIDVADTGPGIPPDEAERVFEPFHQMRDGFTRTRSGVGLGLYIVRQLMHQMAGSVGVVSEVGYGSTFTLRLPLEA
jgi:signal transduction histidine kinase